MGASRSSHGRNSGTNIIWITSAYHRGDQLDRSINSKWFWTTCVATWKSRERSLGAQGKAWRGSENLGGSTSCCVEGISKDCWRGIRCEDGRKGKEGGWDNNRAPKTNPRAIA